MFGRDRQRISGKPTLPFLTIENESRRINRSNPPSDRIRLLTRGVFSSRKTILPPEIIPVIDMKSHGNNLLPKTSVGIQVTQPGFGSRATAASFRGVKFKQGYFFGPGPENRFRMSRNQGDGNKDPEAFHNRVDPENGSPIPSLEISRAKALARFPGCRAAWKTVRGENVFKNEQNRAVDTRSPRRKYVPRSAIDFLRAGFTSNLHRSETLRRSPHPVSFLFKSNFPPEPLAALQRENLTSALAREIFALPLINDHPTGPVYRSIHHYQSNLPFMDFRPNRTRLGQRDFFPLVSLSA